MYIMKNIYILFLTLVTFSLAIENYYAILGLEKSSTEKEIKSAYRKLSLKYHPDKNPGNQEAHDKFLHVGEAYEILSNAEKKANYDEFGDPNGRPNQFGGAGGGFGDMFNQFFHNGQQQHQEPRGQNAQLNLHVPLKDFYNGNLLEFDVEMSNLCEPCEGTGSKDKQRHQCDKCGGLGQVIIQRQMGNMIQRFQSQCDKCGGRGNTIETKCSHCHGHGAKQGPRHYDVYVKPGHPRNSDIVMAGEADKIPGHVPGDLVIHLREELTKSWGYRRINNNLYRTEVLTMKEASAGGWDRAIPFFGDDIEDQHEINISRTLGTVVFDGEVEVLKGSGMPIYSDHDLEEYGDLFIEYKVLVPGKGGIEHDEL